MAHLRRVGQAYLPGLEPPRPRRVQRAEDVAKDLVRVEEICVEMAGAIRLLRANRNLAAAVSREDIANCCDETRRLLQSMKLPLPSDVWLADFIVELCWWHEIPTDDSVPKPRIDVLAEQPRVRSPRAVAGPFDDGRQIGWDPWGPDGEY